MDFIGYEKFKQERQQKRKKALIGWISAVLIVLAYALLSFEILSSKSFGYNLINLIGGAGLAWRVWQDKNYSNFVLELIFISIALFSIIKSLLF